MEGIEILGRPDMGILGGSGNTEKLRHRDIKPQEMKKKRIVRCLQPLITADQTVYLLCYHLASSYWQKRLL